VLAGAIILDTERYTCKNFDSDRSFHFFMTAILLFFRINRGNLKRLFTPKARENVKKQVKSVVKNQQKWIVNLVFFELLKEHLTFDLTFCLTLDLALPVTL